MRLVVTSGTGTAANVPGQPVFGKTGTAEFGNANPPSTHAWFIGFRGDLAFAVLVEGGGVGGSVAAPIAARFLRATS
jgi:cell division protein FtsI/penicillin-binding protein 2